MKIVNLLLFLTSFQSQALAKVNSIQAVLHESATGLFSYDLLKTGPLGNGIVSYNGLLVTVEVESKGGTIQLSLFELGKNKKTLFKSDYITNGKTFIPAFIPLNKIGCSPIEVDVSTLEGGTKKTLKKETLLLGPCYE